MHPPLGRPHPLCEREVAELMACHKANPFMKFLDACGGAKTALDACFREEKHVRVSLNRRIADPLEKAAAAAAAASAAPSDAAGAGGGGARR